MADEIESVYDDDQAELTGQHVAQASKSKTSPQDRATPASGFRHQPKKRLVICCDGTYNNSVSTDNPLTNVPRLSRCIDEVADDGTLQITYYHAGIGSGTSHLANMADATTGRGRPTVLIDILGFYRLILHRHKPYREKYLHVSLLELQRTGG